ncbi:zinc finger protein 226 [Folsomia candida]|uniref:Zinc finger protein 26 n=1 Tax=Folsomia candida TaxID=158441 RepID=A0A226DCB2_FOLCA|nr:zinc finger protein 226 [Folsomia candida]OXA42474.1 Zinc finger protein 26 [Folsomia candida]
MKQNGKEKGKKKIVFRCDICHEDIPRDVKQKHIRAHFAINRRPRKCKLCDKTFACPVTLEIHLRSHTKEMLYSCDTCGKEFGQKSNWKTHQKKVHHVPADMIQCGTCYTKVKKSTGLERHAIFCGKESDYYSVKEVLNPDKNPNARKKTDTIWRCKLCPDKPKRRKEYVEEHVIRIHLKVKLYSCYFCGTKFVHRTELQMHLRLHTGEKPFTCKTCGKGFTQSTHYQAHLVSHSEERSFKCALCPKTCKTLSALKIHAALHTQEKHFKCTVQDCGKGFHCSRSLAQHIDRDHLKRFPFSCEVKGCRKVCLTRQEVKMHHIHSHTDEKPFLCTLCNVGYKTNGKLLEHRRKNQRHKKLEEANSTL